MNHVSVCDFATGTKAIHITTCRKGPGWRWSRIEPHPIQRRRSCARDEFRHPTLHGHPFSTYRLSSTTLDGTALRCKWPAVNHLQIPSRVWVGETVLLWFKP